MCVTCVQLLLCRALFRAHKSINSSANPFRNPGHLAPRSALYFLFQFDEIMDLSIDSVAGDPEIFVFFLPALR